MRIGEVSENGNVHCPVCGRWTGKNVYVDNPPYECQWCGANVVLLPRQEKFYKSQK